MAVILGGGAAEPTSHRALLTVTLPDVA